MVCSRVQGRDYFGKRGGFPIPVRFQVQEFKKMNRPKRIIFLTLFKLLKFTIIPL